MKKSFDKLISGYLEFRKKYASGEQSIMKFLAQQGQNPDVMIVACCDSRVDPAIILQCAPGELFITRNVANIIPPYEPDKAAHSTSAALEFGICYLKVKHLIILGHSHCGGIEALLNPKKLKQDDFLTNWISLLKPNADQEDPEAFAKEAPLQSYKNSLTFPWIAERVKEKSLEIHLWHFDIKEGEISSYSFDEEKYKPLI